MDTVKELSVEQGNRLIAEFMGGKFLHGFDPTYITFKDIQFADLSGNYSCHLADCYFHSSWSWLMPVVEKIEGLSNYGVVISQFSCSIFEISIDESSLNIDVSYNSKIEAVWNAVIEFIQWYNQSKQKP